MLARKLGRAFFSKSKSSHEPSSQAFFPARVAPNLDTVDSLNSVVLNSGFSLYSVHPHIPQFSS